MTKPHPGEEDNTPKWTPWGTPAPEGMIKQLLRLREENYNLISEVRTLKAEIRRIKRLSLERLAREIAAERML